MLTILSSRSNSKETILSIGYTNSFEENETFAKCLANGCGIKMKKRRKYGIQKSSKKAE